MYVCIYTTTGASYPPHPMGGVGTRDTGPYISPLALAIPNILTIQKVHVSRDTRMSQHDFLRIFQSKDEHPVTSIITSIIFENARIIHYDTRISSNITSIIYVFFQYEQWSRHGMLNLSPPNDERDPV